MGSDSVGVTATTNVTIAKCGIPDCMSFGQHISIGHVHDFRMYHERDLGKLVQEPNRESEHSAANKSYRIPLAWRFDLIPPLAIRRLAAIFEEGTIKYGEARYIEKPLPYSVILNHAVNHLLLFASGDRTEDHLAKVMWGMCALMVTEELIEDGFVDSTCDLSKYGAAAHAALQKYLDSKQEQKNA